MAAQSSQSLTFGPYRVDRDQRLLFRGSKIIPLAPRLYDTLLALVESGGTVLDKEDLLKRVWQDAFVEEGSLARNVSTLRKILGESPRDQKYIVTIPKRGYRFAATVTTFRASDQQGDGPDSMWSDPASARPPTGEGNGAMPLSSSHPASERRAQQIAPNFVGRPLEECLQPPSIAPFAAAPVKRYRTWMIAAALAALSASGLWLFGHRPTSVSAEFPVRLTAYPGSEWGAAFSPDNRQIAFAWNGVNQNNYDIYLKTSGSESPIRLTTNPAADVSPAWSPDGRRIAFLRSLGGCRVGLMMIPAAGGPEVKIAEAWQPRVSGQFETNYCLPSTYRNLAFSPDGNWLITPDRETSGLGQLHDTRLFMFSVEDGSRRRVTIPPRGDAIDINPALSPDGRSLAFVRGSYRSSDLYVLVLDPNLSARGEPRRLTFWKRFTANPAWTADGREIVVSSGDFEKTRLWRVPVSGSGKVSVIASAGDFATLPAFAPDGRLAFTRTDWNLSISVLDLSVTPNTGSKPRMWPASSTSIDSAPRFSPDGRRVVFVSNRSGAHEVWMANADGSAAFQLTSVRATFMGSPSWSPDGSTILFDATNHNGRFEVYEIKAAGGEPHRLVGSSGEDDAVASFSTDGRWIYFASNRTGEFQIWRMPAEGGEAVQWTRRGGHCARESADGQYLYFAKTPPDRQASLWRMPAAGGEETQVLESLWAWAWDVTQSGIYYEDVPSPVDGVRATYFYSLATRRRTQLADAGVRSGEGLAVSPDEKLLLRGQATGIGADLMVLENFR